MSQTHCPPASRKRSAAFALLVLLQIGAAPAGRVAAEIPETRTVSVEEPEWSVLAPRVFRGAKEVREQEMAAALTARDTLYLFDMVHGDVKVIATSSRGDLVRVGSTRRHLAFAGQNGPAARIALDPRWLLRSHD